MKKNFKKSKFELSVFNDYLVNARRMTLRSYSKNFGISCYANSEEDRSPKSWWKGK